jgi:hypothetical protein
MGKEKKWFGFGFRLEVDRCILGTEKEVVTGHG